MIIKDVMGFCFGIGLAVTSIAILVNEIKKNRKKNVSGRR
jgi:hypothetical protein